MSHINCDFPPCREVYRFQFTQWKRGNYHQYRSKRAVRKIPITSDDRIQLWLSTRYWNGIGRYPPRVSRRPMVVLVTPTRFRIIDCQIEIRSVTTIRINPIVDVEFCDLFDGSKTIATS